MKIVWREKASNDLEDIFNFIQLQSPQNAVMVFSEIYNLVNSLTIFPERNPIDKSVNDPNVRFAVVWNYKITYSIEEDVIVILRIFGTRQHPKKLTP